MTVHNLRDNVCQACNGPIQIMVFKNSDHCSDNCRKVLEPDKKPGLTEQELANALEAVHSNGGTWRRVAEVAMEVL